ncbi:IRE kinase [Tubulinosema ratisbonensis]|uniref:IRE kinase n=1 Tax=Tubulinosema ratisbonensis TaxID=291195 RepID=A0A437AR18_9MICR|nr:IRE kinase [Tubulinosema ratisbonensis]
MFLLLIKLIHSLILVEYKECLYIYTNDYKFITKKELSSFYHKELSYPQTSIQYTKKNYQIRETCFFEGEGNILPFKLTNQISLSNKAFIDGLFVKDDYLWHENVRLFYLNDISKPIYFNNVMILLSYTQEFISFMNIFFILKKRKILLTDLFSFYKKELCTTNVVGVNHCDKMIDKLDGIHITFKYNNVNLLYTLGVKKSNLLSLPIKKIKRKRNLFFLLPFIFPILFFLKKKKKIFFKGMNYNLYFSTFNNKKVIIKEYKEKDFFEKEERILSDDNLGINFLYKKSKLVIFEYSDSFLEGVNDFVSFSFDLSKLLSMLKKYDLSYTSLDHINLRVKNNKPILLNFDKESIQEYKSKEILEEESKINGIINDSNIIKDEECYSDKFISSSFFFTKNINNWENEIIFQLGIIIHKLIYKKHPYNVNEDSVENNIKKELREPVNRLIPCDFLIRSCLQKKLTLNQLLVHPFFWSYEKKFLFLASLSDVLEKKDLISVKLFKRLERNKHHIFTGEWIDYLDSAIYKDLFSFREYTNTVQGLLRAIRNKGRHYVELPVSIKNIYKSFPDGYMSYYESKFDGLIMISYISGMIVRSEDVLKNFYNVTN